MERQGEERRAGRPGGWRIERGRGGAAAVVAVSRRKSRPPCLDGTKGRRPSRSISVDEVLHYKWLFRSSSEVQASSLLCTTVAGRGGEDDGGAPPTPFVVRSSLVARSSL